jgi:DNA-binding Xre family transcriptional regulator
MENILKTTLTNAVRNTETQKAGEILGISHKSVIRLRKGEGANINSDKLLDFILDYMAHPRIITCVKEKI